MSRRGLTIRHGALSDGEWVTIPGPPVGKGRPRLVHVRVYTPPKTKRWESVAKAILRIGWNGPPLEGPVRVEVRQVEARPKRFKGPAHRHPCPLNGKHPDADNVAKAVLDSIQGIAFKDDAQLTELRTFKVWASAGESPKVEIRVSAVELDDQLSLWGGR